MSKKGFDEFIIDNSLLDDTKSRNQTKFLSEKDNESIMLSVPTGFSDRSMVSNQSYKKKTLIDIGSSHDSNSVSSGSDMGFSEESLHLDDEVFPSAALKSAASLSASFPEQSIHLDEEVFPPPAASKSLAAASLSFPEQSIQLDADAVSFPEQSMQSIQLDEEVVPPAAASKSAATSFPEQSIQLDDDGLNQTTTNLDDAFGGIVEESMPNCGSGSISKPMFDDFSMSTIQLDDYKPTNKKNGEVGAIVNSSTKILHLPPTSIEDLIENAANSSNKSVNLFLKMEKTDDHISISSVSLSKENDKPANSNEMNISFDGKKGHYTVNNNGNVSEKIIETDSYADFISKIYEPLMGRKNSISDFTIESGTDDEDEVDGS